MASQVVKPLCVGDFVRVVGCDQMGHTDRIGQRGRIFEVSTILGETACNLQFVDDGDRQEHPSIDGCNLERLVGDELVVALKEDEDGRREEELALVKAQSQPLAKGEYVRFIKCWGQVGESKRHVGRMGRVISDQMEHDGDARVWFMDDGSRCLTAWKNLERLVGEELAAVKTGECLVAAVKDGRFDDAKAMLATGATVESMDIDGEPAAIWAVQNGHLDRLDALIAAHANIHALNSKGSTAVMVAADGNRHECLAALIAAKADVNVRSKGGVTATSLASRKGHTECLQLLVAAKCDVDTQESHICWTPIMFAARKGHMSCIRVLIAAAANLDAQARQQPAGMTATMAAAMEGHTSCLDALITARACVDTRGEDGWTALLYAAARGHVGCSKILIDTRADLEMRLNKSKKTALILASESGNADTLTVLITARADVNSQERNQVTAAIQASLNNRASCVAALIGAKADLSIASGGSSGMTALGWANSEGNTECVTLLRQAGASE